MAELIDRDALKAHYAWWGDTDERRTFDNIVDAQPAVEAVPVVRCKDCKHLTIVNKKPVYAVCRKTGLVFKSWEEDTRAHFCSYGERKEQA